MTIQEHKFLAKKFKYRFLHSLKPLVFELQSLAGRLIYPKNITPKNSLLHIGCGPNVLSDFENVDFYNFKIFNSLIIGHDLRFPLPFKDSVFDGALSEHTLEHLYPKDAAHLLKEIRRTLRKGSVLRIIVPNLKMYVNFYNGDCPNPIFKKFDSGCEAIWSLTQNWSHLSCWDSEMLISQLLAAGFTSASEVSYRQGLNPKLLLDLESRKWESLYVEAIA